MTTQEQIETERARFRLLINNWCPENLLDEGMPNTLMRAFLAATACCADQYRVLHGQAPIRPLNSHPNPMVGFHDTPTGQKTTNQTIPLPLPPEIQTDLLLTLQALVNIICISERDVTLEDCDHAKEVIEKANSLLSIKV